MKTKLCKPILVPTKKSSILGIGTIVNKLYYSEFGGKSLLWENQELILISLDPEEKIEVGDLYYDEFSTTSFGVSDSHSFIKKCENPIALDNGCQKVITTQQQLPQQYIQQFVEQYNLGKVEDVEIEMTQWTSFSGNHHNTPTYYNPKLINNQVQIVKKKPILYIEEEVKTLLEEHSKFMQHKIGYESYCIGDTEDWFEQNKKK